MVLGAVLIWWLWPSDPPPSDEPGSFAELSANEGALPTEVKPSAWSAPIQSRGERSLTGLVLREGKPVAGAVVTAVAAHGEEVLSDLPCKCDNHCGQMLLACGCAEASGQLVELVSARTGESAPLARATSDAAGKFTLSGLETSTLTLFADATEGVGWLGNVASDAQDTKISIVVGRTIRGKVLTTDSKPAKGALVTAIFAAHSRFFDVVTDDKGEFRLGPLPLGEYAVVAMQGGLLPDHKQVDEDETEALTLELSVPRSLSGVVLSDGAPVSGATVKLEGMHRKRTVTSDSKGEFRIERLRPGDYELTAESSNGMGVASAVITKREDRGGVTITLGQGEPLSGRVVTERAAPVVGARVSLLVGKKWRHTDSDAEGAFRFQGVGTDEQDLYAVKAGFLDARMKARGGQSGIELRMSSAAVLSGLVRSSAGELVLKYSISATASDGGTENQHDVSQKSVDGGFALEVWPGEYELSVEAPPLARLTLKASAPAGGLVLVMKPGATIRGKVFDEDGLPAVGARVFGSRQSPRTQGERAKTGSDGRFELAGLSAGTWVVEAEMLADGYLPTWSASGEVTLEEAGNAEVVLRPKPGVPFSGVVISSAGEPVPGATVIGWQSASDGGVRPSGTSAATTDSEGRFRLRSLHAGPVQLSVELEEQQLEAHQKSVAPDENVVVKLNQGTTISGRVVNGEGQPITTFDILHETLEAADGRFSLPMEPRTKVLAFDAEGYAQLMRQVKLVPGDNPLGDVVMQRGRPVTGVVRDARTKLPIEGALVDVGVEKTDDFFLSEKMGAAKTDAQGRYRLAAVDSSSVYIFATAPTYVSTSQSRTGSTADLELKPASVLTVKVFDATGQPVPRAYVVATRPQMVPLRPTSTSGTYESRDLAPGAWTVSVHSTDSRTFRSVQVTLGDAPTEVVMREATDGVTVELKPTEPAEAVLIPGTVSPTGGLKAILMRGDSVRVQNGVAHNVLPGPWTVLLFRTAVPPQVAFQSIEVKAGNNPPWTISPQWQPFNEAEFGR